MIPADHVTIDGDRVLIATGDDSWALPIGLVRNWRDLDRPCDTCGRMFDNDIRKAACRDCSGTGRYVFTIEVQGEQSYDDQWRRVSVAPTELRVHVERLLPIVSSDWPGHLPVVSQETNGWMYRPWALDEEREFLTLPPVARPGMWLVECRTVPENVEGGTGRTPENGGTDMGDRLFEAEADLEVALLELFRARGWHDDDLPYAVDRVFDAIDKVLTPENVEGPTFKEELTALLNRHSVENASDTPDFVLAEYLMDCLGVWETAVSRRDKWYGFNSTSENVEEPTLDPRCDWLREEGRPCPACSAQGTRCTPENVEEPT